MVVLASPPYLTSLIFNDYLKIEGIPSMRLLKNLQFNGTLVEKCGSLGVTGGGGR